jgi:hypothetical protein
MYVRYLYSINCPAVICLPSMLLFILWRDATSELWTLVQFPLHYFTILLLLALFTLLALLLSFYHSIRSILCSQQTGEIDNLIEVGSKVLGCVVCWFHVAAGEKVHADKQLIWRPCPECHEASKHHLLKFGFLLLVRLNLGFITEGNLLLCSTKPSSWGSQLGALTSHHHRVPAHLFEPNRVARSHPTWPVDALRPPSFLLSPELLRLDRRCRLTLDSGHPRRS